MARQVRLIIPVGMNYSNMIALGVSNALKDRPDWIVRLHYSQSNWASTVEQWKPDALIVSMHSQRQVEMLSGINLPMVNISGAIEPFICPTVIADCEAVGAMAAQYFLNLNLKHFAFWGLHRGAFAKNRYIGFARELYRSGVDQKNIFTCEGDDNAEHKSYDDILKKWLRNLPKPIGLLANHDASAYYINDIARQTGIDIPNEIALLGVDNDQLLCEITRPSLSSVSIATARIGYEAVILLEKMLAGKKVNEKHVTVPPLGVVSRGSTEMLAVDDPDMIRAIMFIRNHASDEISVADLLDNIPVSRKTLESKFKSCFNRTPGAEIRRIRLERAMRLLVETSMPMPEVARHSGFSCAEYMATVFAKEIHMAPTAYRKMFSVAGDGPCKFV